MMGIGWLLGSDYCVICESENGGTSLYRGCYDDLWWATWVVVAVWAKGPFVYLIWMGCTPWDGMCIWFFLSVQFTCDSILTTELSKPRLRLDYNLSIMEGSSPTCHTRRSTWPSREYVAAPIARGQRRPRSPEVPIPRISSPELTLITKSPTRNEPSKRVKLLVTSLTTQRHIWHPLGPLRPNHQRPMARWALSRHPPQRRRSRQPTRICLKFRAQRRHCWNTWSWPLSPTVQTMGRKYYKIN